MANISDRVVSRRSLLRGSFILGVSLQTSIIGLAASSTTPGLSDTAMPPEPGDFIPNAFIQIDADNRITFLLPNIEMGQGTHMAEAVLIAEELDVDVTKVRVVDAPPDAKKYANPELGFQGTGGSTSMNAMWKPLRQAGATARQMLLAAAAQKWGVAVGELSSHDGAIVHSGSGRSASYGELASSAGQQTIPSDAPLKSPDQYKLIGKIIPRIDIPDKDYGKTIYCIDVQIPGMKIGTVRGCPVLGGKLKSLDEKNARKMAGVVDILKLDDAVAVVANSYWCAKQALDAMIIEWDYGANGDKTTDVIFNALHAAFGNVTPINGLNRGDARAKFVGANKTLNAQYISPVLAHAAMEPISCTAQVFDDHCDVWVGTQVPVDAQETAAKITGLPKDKVNIYNHLMGGAFGRRLFSEYVAHTVAFARQVKYPLKIIWSREEDISRDMFRPGYVDHIAAGLNADDRIVSWQQQIACGSILAANPPGLPAGKMDSDVIEGAATLLYDLPNALVDWYRVDPPIRLGWWRGVGANHNTFVVESFMDELAHLAGVDPLEFRRRHLSGQKRALAVLDLVAEKSGWGKKLPERSGMGLSFHSNFKSFLACVVEVAVADDGHVSLKTVHAAIDCGTAVAPNVVEAQLQGGILFGISSALYSEIDFEHGQSKQGNFDSYRVLRIDEAPDVFVHRVANSEHPGGVGEAGNTGAQAALTNAIFAATGVRLRQLPIEFSLLRKSASAK